MEGDLGGEYNCLYTTKELKCKPREDRDPIRLKGDLGKELDPFNPDDSASFRRRSERTPRRDPILGTGDFSSEPDPFPHLNSRGRFYRQSKERTDPITHSFPERGARNRHSMRQYNERWIMRDPILHRYGDENGQPVQRLNEMRHFAQQRAGNSWLSSSAKNLSSNDGSTRRPYVQRNPITGEGMRPEDYNDLQRVPSEYHFRQNPTVAHHVPSPRPMMSKSISATMAQPSRPTRSAVSPPRSFMRTTKSPMKSMDSTTIKEAPVGMYSMDQKSAVQSVLRCKFDAPFK